MDMQGEYRIPAAREIVWDALNDPAVLKACIQGCQSLERTDEGGFDATVKAKVGPVSATFKGAVRLENINAPESYTIVGEGKGGAAGFAKGSADVALADDGGETVLSYSVKATVGGKLAQIGGRLIDSTAKKYATDFFEKFVALVVERAETAAPATEPSPDQDAPQPTPAADPAPTPPEEPQNQDDIRETAAQAAISAADKTKAGRGLTPTQWILVLAIVLVGLTMMFGGDPATTPSGN